MKCLFVLLLISLKALSHKNLPKKEMPKLIVSCFFTPSSFLNVIPQGKTIKDLEINIDNKPTGVFRIYSFLKKNYIATDRNSLSLRFVDGPAKLELSLNPFEVMNNPDLISKMVEVVYR